jgi:hypothetical protein
MFCYLDLATERLFLLLIVDVVKAMNIPSTTSAGLSTYCSFYHIFND